MGFHNITMEMDSLSLRNILNKDWRIPWELTHIIEECMHIMEDVNIQVVHVYREANQLADFMANLAIHSDGTQKFHTFSQLPSQARGILNTDKHQIPILRIRPGRGITSTDA